MQKCLLLLHHFLYVQIVLMREGSPLVYVHCFAVQDSRIPRKYNVFYEVSSCIHLGMVCEAMWIFSARDRSLVLGLAFLFLLDFFHRSQLQ